MGIIFDLDGTLINSQRQHKLAVKNAIYKVFGDKSVPASFIMENIRYPSYILFKKVQKKYGLQFSGKNLRRVLSLRDGYMNFNAARTVKFFHHVKETISFLKSKGVKVGIATAMNKTQLSAFTRALDLTSLTGTIVCPSSIRTEKPNPYILNKTITLSGMRRSKTVYVGDSPYDLIAARRAGVSFIGIYNRELEGNNPFMRDFSAFYRYVRKNYAKYLDN